MINLRYHIVSLTAVFLALAIGVVMGTTFLNDATVDELNRQISQAREGINETNATNEQLRGELDRYHATDQALLDAGPRLVGDQLPGVPVLIVANGGIDDDSLARVRTLIDMSGADLRGTLTVGDRLRLDAGDDPDLAAILGTSSGGRAVQQAELTSAFAATLDDAADRSVDSSADAPALVQALIDGGYLAYEPAEGSTDDATTVLAGGGYRYVFVSGAEPTTPDGEFLLPVVRDMASEGPTPVVYVSAAVGDDAEAVRTVAVGPIRDDPELRAAVSTVDDLERFSGLLATVWALDDLGAGIQGHYGVGAGSDSELPTVS